MTESADLLADSGLDGSATAPLPPANRATWTGNDAQTDEKIDRDQLLVLSSDLIRSLHRRISGHRFRANKHDGTRLAVARALVQAITAHNQVLRDMEQEEIKDRLARIEATLETRDRDQKYLEQIEREQAKRRRP
jgi:hypothetical protein